MKNLFILPIFLTGMAYADVFGASPMGPNITGCLKLSPLYFCKKFYGNALQAINEANLCQTQNGGDGFSIQLHYSTDPTLSYYAIYWVKCLEFEIGGMAPSGNGFAAEMSAVLQTIFDHPVQVSEFLAVPDGNVRVYLADQQGGLVYESIWNPAGELQDLRAIDPESDALLRQTLMDRGLGFATLAP